MYRCISSVNLELIVFQIKNKKHNLQDKFYKVRCVFVHKDRRERELAERR